MSQLHSTPYIIEQAIRHEKCLLSNTGALVAYSGAKTGRSPADKRIVDNEAAKAVWWSQVNRPLNQTRYNIYLDFARKELQTADNESTVNNESTADNKLNVDNESTADKDSTVDNELTTNNELSVDDESTNVDNSSLGSSVYKIDAYAGWDEEFRLKIRVYTKIPYHALFMRNMLIPASTSFDNADPPDFTIYNMGRYKLSQVMDARLKDIQPDESLKDTLIALDLQGNTMVIYGTEYAGEMKKGVLTLMMYRMPLLGHLTLHSSANIDKRGEVCFFFGLSGTGKTSLSTDADHIMIGDDEHVWTDKGIFNIEGGCYAKCIDLDPQSEPEIFQAIRWGAVLENVVVREDRSIDYHDTHLTKNTRVSYPLQHLQQVQIPATAGHPQHILFLTCDAFGLLPPVSKLSVEQAVMAFVCGYTSKIPGTEVGVEEPQACFSACFGEPFIFHPPQVYGELLKQKILKYHVQVWLVNTGWVGGGYGVGSRIPIRYSRAIVRAVQKGHIGDYHTFPYFEYKIPGYCEGVPAELLDPRSSWRDTHAYDSQLQKLWEKFHQAYLEKIQG